MTIPQPLYTQAPQHAAGYQQQPAAALVVPEILRAAGESLRALVTRDLSFHLPDPNRRESYRRGALDMLVPLVSALAKYDRNVDPGAFYAAAGCPGGILPPPVEDVQQAANVGMQQQMAHMAAIGVQQPAPQQQPQGYVDLGAQPGAVPTYEDPGGHLPPQPGSVEAAQQGIVPPTPVQVAPQGLVPDTAAGLETQIAASGSDMPPLPGDLDVETDPTILAAPDSSDPRIEVLP